MTTFTAPFKCSNCKKTDRCEKIESTKGERFLGWFNRTVKRDSVAKYMEGSYKVYCVKCEARRPELEKRDYVTK